MLLNTSEATATLLVGVDIFRNERKQVSSQPRTMTGIVLVGANAINECEVDFYIEDFYVGRYRNSRNGVVAPILPDDFQGVGRLLVPAGSKISGIIAVVPTVSPLLCQVY